MLVCNVSDVRPLQYLPSDQVGIYRLLAPRACRDRLHYSNTTTPSTVPASPPRAPAYSASATSIPAAQASSFTKADPVETVLSRCWNALMNNPGTKMIQNAAPELVGTFRSDDYGYVVCRDQPPESTYAFAIDHHYPLSRCV